MNFNRGISFFSKFVCIFFNLFFFYKIFVYKFVYKLFTKIFTKYLQNKLLICFLQNICLYFQKRTNNGSQQSRRGSQGIFSIVFEKITLRIASLLIGKHNSSSRLVSRLSEGLPEGWGREMGRRRGKHSWFKCL